MTFSSPDALARTPPPGTPPPRRPRRAAAIALAALFTLGAGGDPLRLLGLLSDISVPGTSIGLGLFIEGPLIALSALGAPIVWAAALWPDATRRFGWALTLLSVWALPGLLFLGPGTGYGALYLLALWATATGLWTRAHGAGRVLRGVGGAICLWSLIGLGAALLQIQSNAHGQPYCIARGGEGPASLADLRGLAFFTNSEGYKSTSRWYFNGLLLTPEAQWNWSARRLSFQPIAHPGRFIANPRDPRAACTPERGYLGHHLF